MYYVNKIIGVLISPTVMGFVVLAALLLLRAKRRYLWIVLGLLWFWMSAIPGRILGLPLEREWLVGGDIPTAESFPKADVIVCLGGGMGAATNEVHGANMSQSADRVWMAARLWKLGKAPKIICTGPGCEASTRGLLLDLGVPADAMIFLQDARNTEEEARRIVRLFGCSDCLIGGGAENQTIDQLTNLKNRTILLVTSAWHMRRAKLMFEKYAPEVGIVPAPTDFEATIVADSGFDVRELLPGNAVMTEAYLREWIGYLGYRFLR